MPVLATIVNSGGAVSNSFNVNFSFCRFDPQAGQFCNVDAAFTAFPPILGAKGQNIDFANVAVDSIQGNSEITVPTTLLTDTLLSGNYVIRIAVDTDNTVLETDEGDNILITQPPLILGEGNASNGGNGDPDGDPTTPNNGQTEADLLVGTYELSKGLLPVGANLDFDYEIVNQGVQDAGSFVVSVFYQKIGGAAVEFDRVRVDGLGARQSITLSSRLDTSGFETGRYAIIVVVDLFNEVQESFEANNRQERWLRIV